MSKKNRHGVPNPNGRWDVKAPGAGRASSDHGTQVDAERKAKEIVGNLGGGEARFTVVMGGFAIRTRFRPAKTRTLRATPATSPVGGEVAARPGTARTWRSRLPTDPPVPQRQQSRSARNIRVARSRQTHPLHARKRAVLPRLPRHVRSNTNRVASCDDRKPDRRPRP